MFLQVLSLKSYKIRMHSHIIGYFASVQSIKILTSCMEALGHLKIYPTWGRSQRDELNRISIKYIKYVRKISKGDKLSAKKNGHHHLKERE